MELPRKTTTSAEKNTVKEAIFNHLKMQTNGALMLTGNWGSGKTFFLKNEVFPEIEKETDFVPIMVSLYGETNKTNIAHKVLFAYFDSKGKNTALSTGTLVKNIQNLAAAIPKVNQFIDIGKIITGTGNNLFKLIPHQKLLIVFDDLERMGDQIEINDFLGLINDLVENKGCKILLVANEAEIKGELTYREKTIDKSIYFFPEIDSILDSIISSYGKNESFQKYLDKNRIFILKTLDFKTGNDEDQKELEKSLTNIRTIKFAIEHFEYCFKIVTNGEEELDSITLQQLRNLWVFILAISAEYKKPKNLTYNNRRTLDKQNSAFANFEINLSEIVWDNNDINEQEKEIKEDWNYSENFIELYYSRFNENYIFHRTVYEFITAGKSISENELLTNLKNSFNVNGGQVDPAHNLLNRFSEGFWNFTSEEFPRKLSQLVGFVERAKLNDLGSYFSAGVFLFKFIEFTKYSEDRLIAKMKEGLGKFISSKSFNIKMKRQFQMISLQFKSDKFRDIVQFVDQKIKKVENDNKMLEVNRLEKLFKQDLGLFAQAILSEDPDFVAPSWPFLHHLKDSVGIELIKKWSPKEIMDLTYVIEKRFINSGLSNSSKEEVLFIEALMEEIQGIDLSKPELSYYVIKDRLMPILRDGKNRLKS